MHVMGLPLLLSLRITDNVLTRSAGAIYRAGVTFPGCVCSASVLGFSKGVLSLCLIPPLTHRQHARDFLCGGVCWRALAVRWPTGEMGSGRGVFSFLTLEMACRCRVSLRCVVYGAALTNMLRNVIGRAIKTPLPD